MKRSIQLYKDIFIIDGQIMHTDLVPDSTVKWFVWRIDKKTHTNAGFTIHQGLYLCTPVILRLLVAAKCGEQTMK